jgi:hypothetical protein
MKMNVAITFVLICVLCTLAGCEVQGPTETATPIQENRSVASSVVETIQGPSPSVGDVSFFYDSEWEVMRIATLVSNPSDRPIEGIVSEWIAFDENNAIVGSYKWTLPPIPANGSIPYVGGASSVHMTGTPVRAEISLIEPGLFASDYQESFRVTNIAFMSTEYLDGAYTISANAEALTDLKTSNIVGWIIIRDADGIIIGADFVLPDNLPDQLSSGTSFVLSQTVFTVLGEPASVEVSVFNAPQ